MDIRQLRHFIAIYDQGSFAQAAAKLNLSQPAISNSMAQLERYLGVRLFDRGAFGARPTTYAERLYDSAKLIVSEVERSSGDITAMQKGEAGTVAIGIGPLFEHAIGPELIAQFVNSYSNVNVTVAQGVTSDLYARLGRGELDFTISTPPSWIQPDDGISVEVLGESSDVIVCGHDHALWDQSDCSLQQLARYPWVITAQVQEAAQNFFMAFSEQKLSPPKRIIRTDSIGILRKLIVAQGFLCVASTPFATANSATMKIVPNDAFSISRQICLATRKGTTMTRSATILLNLFKKHLVLSGD